MRRAPLAGSASAIVQVSPTDDTLLEGTESVVLTVAANAAYTIGAGNSGSVSLADNEVNLIPKGSANWKYLDNGSNQGTAWASAFFRSSPNPQFARSENCGQRVEGQQLGVAALCISLRC